MNTKTFLFVLLELVAVCGAQKPNIVYVIADDQDVKLGSLEVQDKIQNLLIKEGLFFDNAFVTTPVCCPSRASILTGRLPHNTGTYENSVQKGCNSQSWRDRNENRTIGPLLSANGYKTGFFGKYLNNYALKPSGMGPDHVPPGWDKWYALVGNSKFYHYTVSNDGKAEPHGNSYAEDYFTDRIKNESVNFIMSMKGKQSPFFMYISTPAPHRPATPAPQYQSTFAGIPAPRTDSYNKPGADKHWIISNGTPTMDSTTMGIVDQLYQDRLGTILSVQDLVEEVISALTSIDALKNTYIFYNSDHGYHLGQFKQQGEKRQPYEEDIRVPLIVRGPNVAPDTHTSSIALSIDLYPTFLDLAGVAIPDGVDGRSLKNIITGQKEANWREDFVVEYYGEGGANGCMGQPGGPHAQVFLHDCHNNTFLALRTISSKENTTLALFYKTDDSPISVDEHYFQEFYDIDKDYWQLSNKASSLSPDEMSAKVARIKQYYSCSGKNCKI